MVVPRRENGEMMRSSLLIGIYLREDQTHFIILATAVLLVPGAVGQSRLRTRRPVGEERTIRSRVR